MMLIGVLCIAWGTHNNSFFWLVAGCLLFGLSMGDKR
jgi:hypothetical protein